MAEKYDVVLFGASGWTGMFILDELARVAEGERLAWAVAGRDRNKLKRVLSESSAYTGVNLDHVPIIIADVNNYDSLVSMAQQTSIVLNAVGPFDLYGEPVIKACLETYTHHLDISGEIQFIEGMQLKYHVEAEKKGIFLISSLGINSTMADIGTFLTAKQFAFGGYMTNVECHYMPKAGPSGYSIHTGTMLSVMGIITAGKKLAEIRKQLFPNPLPEPQFKLPERPKLYRSEDTDHMTSPFAETDGTVVKRSIRHFLSTGKLSKPIEFKHYFAYQSLYYGIRSVISLLVFGILMCFACGRKLIKRFPEICSAKLFSRYEPTRQQVSEAVVVVKFVGYGFRREQDIKKGPVPTHVVTTQFVGPESAYQFTAECLVQAGITILREKVEMLKRSGGGVLTPAVAFDETKFIDRLATRNVKFQLLSICGYQYQQP